MTFGTDEPGDPTFESAVARWLGEGQVDDAAAERARQHWLTQQLDEQTTLHGTLINVAEAGHDVVVVLPQRSVRTTLVAVGTDFVLTADQQLVAIDAIDRIETEGRLGDPAPTGSGTHQGLAMWMLLAMLAQDRPLVVVHHRSGATSSGTLERANSDHLVYTERVGASAVVPLQSVAIVGQM